MDKTAEAARKKPSVSALRLAVASSTAVDTRQSIELLEQKLREVHKLRFSHVKLAN